MPELRAPLRLSWDLPSHAPLAGELWARIVGARVLFVEARVAENSLGSLRAVAANPPPGPAPRVSLLGEAATIAAAARFHVGESGFCGEFLLLPPYPPGDLAPAFRDPGAEFAPALWSTPEGLSAFPEGLEIAALLGAKTLAILNPPAPARPLDAAVRSRVASVWSARRPPGLCLRVHDLFLSEALGLDPFGDYAGCQAGAALAHLSEDGRLLACRTLPVELGSLREEPLRELWSAPRRRELRRRLTETPGPCRGCALLSRCGGGCRGLEPGLGRDPSCSGRRLPASEGPSP